MRTFFLSIHTFSIDTWVPIPACTGLKVWETTWKLICHTPSHWHEFAMWEENSVAKGNINIRCAYVIHLLVLWTFSFNSWLFVRYFNLQFKSSTLNTCQQISFSFPKVPSLSLSPPAHFAWSLHPPHHLSPWEITSFRMSCSASQQRGVLSVQGSNFSDAPQCLLGGSDWGVGVLLAGGTVCEHP